MATYAVGDVQGCLDELQALLERVGFDTARDRLWLVGDLVNRGPRSLDTLRFVRALGDRVTCVLGNHDLHLLAAAAGVRGPKAGDTFHDVLGAGDRGALLDWLRRQPLLHHDRELDRVMVHAGLPPQWTLADAAAAAAELHAVLAGDDHEAFLHEMYGNEPVLWRDDLDRLGRLRFTVNALTRMRLVDRDGSLLLGGRAETAAGGRALPWFAHPARRNRGVRIVFGHWSTLQLAEPLDPEHGVFHLDHGCVWGQKLSALRLEDEAWFHQPCPRHCEPG